MAIADESRKNKHGRPLFRSKCFHVNSLAIKVELRTGNVLIDLQIKYLLSLVTSPSIVRICNYDRMRLQCLFAI